MTLFGRAIRYRGGWIYLTAIETGRLMLTHRSSYHICWNAFFCGGWFHGVWMIEMWQQWWERNCCCWRGLETRNVL